MRFILTRIPVCLALLVLSGCGQSSPPADPDGAAPQAAATGRAAAPDASFLLTESPAGAVGVGAARKDSQNAGDVTITGRIGGSEKPFIEGLAAFTIVDPKLKPCPDEEGCPTPWDYCCASGDTLKENTALVKLVSADGKPVAKDARGLLGVKELTRIVVRGKAQRDEQGNLTVLAEKLYVSAE